MACQVTILLSAHILRIIGLALIKSNYEKVLGNGKQFQEKNILEVNFCKIFSNFNWFSKIGSFKLKSHEPRLSL